MKNLFQNPKKILSTFFSAIAIVLVIAMTIVMQNGKKNNEGYDVTSDEYKIAKLLEARVPNVIESNDDIDFKAFFLRDTDGDGYTEDMEEIDQQIGTNDYMFVEVTVNSVGKLKNGKIKINDSNFKWKTAILSNNVIKNNYIGYTDEIELNDLNSGTQILIYGKIERKIGNNIHDYDKESLVTLTGTFVDDDENESELIKESKLKVNWNGTVSTSIPNSYLTVYNIENAIGEEEFTANFSVSVNETTKTTPIDKTLLLQRQEVEIEIPQLNGYNPISVTCNSGNVEKAYDEPTRILTLKREAILDENGNVIKSVSRYGTYSVAVVYPIEAYESLGSERVQLNVKVTGSNYGYQAEKFGLARSATVKTIGLIYKKIEEATPVIVENDTWRLYTSIGTYADNSYRVSKENVQNLYNGTVYEDVVDKYPVLWTVSVGQQEKIKSITLEENSVDKFNGNIDMSEYEKTIGVYFENAQNVLGNDGKIELYDEGVLIETFTRENWGKYTKSKPYEINTSSVKIITSAPISNAYLYVYQIKELNDEKIVQDFTQEQFNELTRIYTYAKGSVEIVEEQQSNTPDVQTRSASATYDIPISIVNFLSSPAEILNQQTQNIRLSITTRKINIMEKAWKDGVFLIELPSDIIAANINDISVSNSNVKIISSIIYKENGKYFVRIDTENENPTTYTISLGLAVNGNPLQSTKTCVFSLYSCNKNGEIYDYSTNDIYDINSNSSTEDRVSYKRTSMELLSTQGLITEEYITDYDDNESVTISPNIAEIDRSDNAKTAKVNISIANNYSEEIDEVVILGRIPFEGNKYILNDNELGSQYTAFIKGPISIPSEIQEYATVYYSEQENPTKDLTDANNGWTQTVTDWTKVKSYLIDFGRYVLRNTGNKILSYEVEVPARTGNNKVAYATHAVYYCLNTSYGKRRMETQPGKVGLQVIQKYNFELTKNKQEFNNIKVAGATYTFTTQDAYGNTITRTGSTDSEGKVVLNGLYAGRKYTIKEISSPNDYVLDNNEYKIVTKIVDNNGVEELKLTNQGENFNGYPVVTTDSNGNYLVKAKLQDDSKYTLVINTQDNENNVINNVRYGVNGKSQGKVYKDINNQVKISGLLLDEEYTVQLMKADGYYTDGEARPFTITRDETTNRIKIVTDDEELKNAIIVEEIEGQSIVTITVRTEKIPTYNLQVIKIEEPTDEVEPLVKLVDAKFNIYSEDTRKTKTFVVNGEDGESIEGLYAYVNDKRSVISGKYTLQEIKAPDGYSNNGEEIVFYVEKNQDGLSINIENEESLNSVYKTEIEDNTVRVIIQDKPLFKLIKEDSENVDEFGNPLLLPNARFVIYELDENRTIIGYAKDETGNYVGEYDADTRDYIVTTDENGEINVPLRAGNYMIKEVGTPEGYYSENSVQVFKIHGNAEVVKEININYIEDLVELSNGVKSGKTYKDVTITLVRTLDFKDDNSYRNPSSTAYGNINEDEKIESIKTELTTGKGFCTIGNNSRDKFSGTFDGQGYEIKNLYINRAEAYVGLFGNTEYSTIKNLGVSGEINVNDTTVRSWVGGIVACVDTGSIINCYSKCEINCSAATGVYGGSTGGIVGYGLFASIIECYNVGDIQSDDNFYNQGGIIGSCYSKTYINNCYNRGAIDGAKYAGGITGSTSNNAKINNCYNIGTVKNNIESGYTGKIVGCRPEIEYSSTRYPAVYNCYAMDSIEIIGNNIDSSGIDISEQEMKQEEFIGLLSDKCWSMDVDNVNDGFPILVQNNGNIDDEIEINYIEDLVEISINSKNGEEYKNKTINLMRSLDFNDDDSYIDSASKVYGDINRDSIISGIKDELTTGEGFYPIGLNSKFCGEFNGNGYEINNLYINTDDGYNIGLFGNIYGAKIQNLSVRGILNYQLTDAYGYAAVYMGGIAGYASNSIINNCTNYCSVNGAYSGGIAGYASNSIINNCTNAGTIEDPVDFGSGNYTTKAGGIVASASNCTIDGCTNIGSIKGTNYSSNKDVGGIVADASNCLVTNCSNNGIVNGEIHLMTTHQYVGGIIGYSSQSDVLHCNNSSNVSGGSGTNYVGGIVGCISRGLIEDCYNGGMVTNEGTNTSHYNSSIYTGGIAGYITDEAVINSCHNSGLVQGYVRGYNDWSNGDAYTGGIVGSISNGMVNCCYNEGIINIYSDVCRVSYYIYAGGLVGCITDYGYIKNSYNIGEIKENVKIDTNYTRSFTSYIGGIAGRVLSDSDIDSCYNIGSFTDYSSSDVKNTVYIGGIIGNGSSVNNSYYPDSLELIGNTVNSLGTAIEENEMKNSEFINVLGKNLWKVDSNLNDGFPVLRTYNEVENGAVVTEIHYVEDLIDFSNSVNNGVSYKDKIVKLTNSLDFDDINSYRDAECTEYGDLNGNGTRESLIDELANGYGYTPIGCNRAYWFDGTFDGQGFEIKNLRIKSSDTYIGLFGGIYNAELRNFSVTGTIHSQSYIRSYVGGIAGYAKRSKINGIKTNINIEKPAGMSGKYAYVGGIIGLSDDSIVSNCANNGNILINSSDDYAGGIVGYSNNIVINCNNNGQVTCSLGKAGGICGQSAGSISNCYNTGTIIIKRDGYVGGIVGNGKNISCCYNSGNIIFDIENGCSAKIGGIVGYIVDNGYITDCYNTGNMEGTYANTNSSRSLNIAGIGGHIRWNYSKLLYNR